MAILLKVKPNTPPKETIINLIDFMHKWLKKIGFDPESFQLLEKAHSEELGGRVLGVYKNLSGIRSSVVDKDLSIIPELSIVIKGLLKLEEPVELRSVSEPMEIKELPAELTIFNRRWRKNVKATANFYTFIVPDWRLYYTNELFRERIENSHSVSYKGLSWEFLIVGKSMFAAHDVREIVYCYYPQRKKFLEDLLKTLKEEIEERTYELPDLLSPYRLDYLAETIDSFGKDVEKKLEKYSIESMVAFEVGSIKLRAKEPNAFMKFYLAFRNDFVNSLKDTLPDTSKFKNILERWIKSNQ